MKKYFLFPSLLLFFFISCKNKGELKETSLVGTDNISITNNKNSTFSFVKKKNSRFELSEDLSIMVLDKITNNLICQSKIEAVGHQESVSYQEGSLKEIKINDQTIFLFIALRKYDGEYYSVRLACINNCKFNFIEGEFSYLEESNDFNNIKSNMQKQMDAISLSEEIKKEYQIYLDQFFLNKSKKDELKIEQQLKSNTTSKRFDNVGDWKKECIENDNLTLSIFSTQTGGYLDIRKDKGELARLSINIDVADDINTYNLSYSMLTSITRYNDFLDWSSISRDSIIGEIEIFSNNKCNFEWYGFYDLETKKRETLNITENNKSLELYKCESN